MNKVFQIAIDGPVGAGKSAVAKKVADALDILYIDTGAMYRAVALLAKREKIAWDDQEGVVGLLEKMEIKLRKPEEEMDDGRQVTLLLNGEDVSWEIRKGDMGVGSSMVSIYFEVRKRLVELQREMARNGSVIMEGRDIGTRVLPEASIKIYMDASVEVRALRKQEQFKKMGEKVSLQEAKAEIMSRDKREMTRKIDPLRPAEGAWILDTTDLSVTQVVDRIVKRVAEL